MRPAGRREEKGRKKDMKEGRLTETKGEEKSHQRNDVVSQRRIKDIER